MGPGGVHTLDKWVVLCGSALVASWLGLCRSAFEASGLAPIGSHFRLVTVVGHHKRLDPCW